MTGIVIVGLFVLALICYLVGQVAYYQGRKSKWEEIATQYIVLHKSVLIQPIQPNKPNKELDKPSKKSYHNKAQRRTNKR